MSRGPSPLGLWSRR